MVLVALLGLPEQQVHKEFKAHQVLPDLQDPSGLLEAQDLSVLLELQD